ncbi:thiopeptide-type bacteriocin biosynthesis protein [uncultured Flavobacterium sp.]|uniref:thiopeptide-type bacteriocin biosynthesis protein n=1 Tax=uncultured Flavobacterium sp. TaxID=165435 RepID=UPI003081AE51
MQRVFCLGSEWLYYKIYTGVQTTDLILFEKFYPIILQLEKRKIIQKWFFIRYNDNDAHFRIRFLIEDKKNLSKAINMLFPVLNDLLQENLVWKVQTDTYQRELERYGENTIEDSEFLFWKDSEMIIQYISLKKAFSEKDMALLFSFCSIDSFLNSFGLSISDKLNLMNSLQISFKEEFEADKTLKSQLDKKYRELLPTIEHFFSDISRKDFPDFFEIIEKKENQIVEKVLEIKASIQIPIHDFLASHIHMMLNRQYTSKQRMYELVVYDHLYRYYKTLNYKRLYKKSL